MGGGLFLQSLLIYLISFYVKKKFVSSVVGVLETSLGLIVVRLLTNTARPLSFR